MVKKDRKNAKGYLRAGKVHQLMGNDLKARQFYEIGLKNVDKNDKLQSVMKQMHETVSRRLSRREKPRSGETLLDPNDSEPRNRQSFDLMQLPVEIIEIIFRYIPFNELVRLQNVSKSWRMFMLNNPIVWSVLDFRQCNKKSIRCSTLRKCLHRAQGSVRELYLYNIWPRDASTIGNEIMPYLLTARLQVLHVDFNINIFSSSNRGNAMSDTQFSAFRNLTVLKLGGCEALESKELVELLCQSTFPSLRVLHFYGSALTRPKSFPTLSKWDNNFKPSNLRSLIIENSGAGMITDTEDLVAFLTLHPHLVSLSLSHFVVSNSAATNRFIDLASMAPHLIELSLIHSLFASAPTVPSTCQKFAIPDSCLKPRTTTRQNNGVEVYSDDSSCVANPDEYRNLRHLDISSNTILSDQDLSGVLSRCDGSLLQRLDMNACPKITAGSVSQIAKMCPALRVLLIGQNSWLNDTALAALNGLRELEYLDISSTDVTFTGVLLYFAGSDIDANGKRIPLTTLAAKIQERVNRYRASGDIGLRLSLKTLVMNSCTGVSLQSSNWIRSLGVHVEHDLSSMYDYTNKNKKKRKL
ncbi:uncharacterized protein V1513DRAFT_457397 [Lipomyces chichibuensis]|uniref:uncharacterized protein n=1 Tax=Lipomyces chichibuensis TaxID=1546026 RepID=UPI0033442098